MINLKWIALDALGINAALIDGSGQIVEVNEAWKRLADTEGSVMHDWFGVNYLSVCDSVAGIDAHSESIAAIASGIRSVLNAEVPEFTYVYRCHSQTLNRWYRMRVILWINAGGKALITHEDISELKAVNEQLKVVNEQLELAASDIAERERFLRSIMDSLPAMLGYWDGELRCRFANTAYLTWFKQSPTSMIGMSIRELLGEALFKLNEPYMREALAGRAQQFERTLVKADGTVGYTLANYIPDKNLQGAVLGFFVLVSDITDFKESENKLRLAEVAVKNTDEAIVVADANGIVISINPAYTAITGFNSDETIGKKMHAFDLADQSPSLFEEMHTALQTVGSWQGELWNRHKNGDAYLEWKRINRVTFGNNALTYYVSLFHDITSLWHQNESIRHLAFYDVLTDLPNRALMTERLRQLCAINDRERRNLAILFLDLDGFKQVNDSLGHDIGDEVLKQVAGILVRQVRNNDTVARLGGDEFVVLVDNPLGRDEIGQLANRILESVARLKVVAGHPVQIGVTIGISLYSVNGRSPEELLKSADTAMYAAKAIGKNCYRFAI